MNTKFIDIEQRVKLLQGLEYGDKDSIRKIFDELSRLEMIIKDYEIGIRVLSEKFSSKIGKSTEL